MSEMRVQRALARAGIASRRAAEELIVQGRVRVDGEVATIGMKVDPDKQRITVSGKAIPRISKRWLAFHKPLGVVTTADDEEGRRTVFDFLPKSEGLAYVGRLDVMTTGLLLLTTDGDAIHRLTHPRYRITRSYVALVHGRPTAELLKAVLEPVVLDGRKVEPSGLRVRPGKNDRSIIDVVLTEGRNRVVRRWVEAMGAKVERLARLSYGPVRLGDLPVGEWRPLTDAEEESIYQAIGMGPGLKPEAVREARQGPQIGRPAPKRRPAAASTSAPPASAPRARQREERAGTSERPGKSGPVRDRSSGSSARRKGPATTAEQAERPVRPGKFRGRGGQPQKKDRAVDDKPMSRREARTPKGRTGRPKGERPPRSGRPW
jgi:23S rRNA pseudouridine2605 synthase